MMAATRTSTRRPRSARRALLVLAILAATVATGTLPASATVQAPAQATNVTAAADNPALVVDSTGDQDDASLTDGVCATAGGACTLRAAIQQANANAGSDRIEFAIGGGGVQRIQLGSSLPSINDTSGGVAIDGYTQPGASANTQSEGSNASIRIEVDGVSGNGVFLIESAENTIRGLSVYGGSDHIELRGEAADGNLIVGNFLGTDASSTRAQGSGIGVILNLGPDRNRIGTPALADRNVISGNGSYGVRLNHGETSQNRIQNNIVGLSADGSRALRHLIGIDVQWWSWGNQVGGTGPNEHNVVGGNDSGIDLSHKATGNLILGNRVGTTLDGRSANSTTRNGRGLILKDDTQGNYYADNIIAGVDNDYAIWHKHNYTGGNSFVNNRIGVGIDGSDIGSSRSGMLLRGHDDVYHGNTFANIGGSETILISNTSVRDWATYEPDEQTLRNAVRMGTYYGNQDVPIEFGSNCCPHPNEDTPAIGGVGPGQVNGDGTCAGCEVEVYASGSVDGDGSLGPGTGTTGRTWIGTVYADQSGVWSMASSDLTVGTRVSAAAITPDGEVSDLSAEVTVPSQGSGLVANPDQPTTPTPPAAPPAPPLYEQPAGFGCSYDDGTLTWDSAGAPEYYVFAVDDGTETYLGGYSGTSLTVDPADSYRVEHWVTGQATNANCQGPGGGGGGSTFTCTYDDGTLTWDDAGASEYYVFAVDDGTESYLGGHTGTSLTTGAADSYRVEHWVTGQATNANCEGPGGQNATSSSSSFTCSYDDGTLTWDDAGAPEYYVFAVDDGTESYLGGHTGTSLTVDPADSYRVEHWVTGQATNANCQG